MVFKLTPSTVIQAWRVPPVRASGKPEAKPNRATTPIRRLQRDLRVAVTDSFLTM